MKIQNVKTVVIPLAFNHPIKDYHCRGAYMRVLAGIYGQNRSTTVIIQTAGYSKKNPRGNGGYYYQSLSEAMRAKLADEMHPWADNFIARPLTWSTGNEIKFAFKVIRQMKIADSKKPLQIIISSNWLHLLRIRWYVFMYKPRAWKVAYRCADHGMSFKDRLYEIPKHVDAMLKLMNRCRVWYRWIRFRSHISLAF